MVVVFLQLATVEFQQLFENVRQSKICLKTSHEIGVTC